LALFRVPFRGSSFAAVALAAIFCLHSSAASLEQSGYQTIASYDLKAVMDSGAVALTTDASGNVYVLGRTRTPAAGAHRIGVGGGVDIAVAKFSPQGQMIYNTVLGGSTDDDPDKMFVDAQGHVFVAGGSASTNFPLKNALHSMPNTYYNLFLCRLAPDGASLVYSTLRWGNLGSYILAILPNGQVILGGSREGASSTINNPESDAVVTGLGEFGTNILFSTALGGMSYDSVTAIGVDPSGAIWAAGKTSSPDFPVTPDAARAFLEVPEQSSYIYNSDGFLAKLSSNGAVLYSSFWGTGQDEWISSITFGNDNMMFLDRTVWSANGLVQIGYQGGIDHPFEPPLPPVTFETREFITLVNPYAGQTIAEALLPTTGYSILSLAIGAGGNAHFGGVNYLAQFDAATSTFPRFAVMDDCVYTSVRGPAMSPAGELWITRFRFDTNLVATEGALLKLVTVLDLPANRQPTVTLDPYAYGFGINSSPTVRGLEPEPFKITPVAADTDGTIQKIELFAGSTLLAVLTNTPYSFSWSNAPHGEHILRAVATDNLGLSSTSCPFTITVPVPPPNDSFYRSTLTSGTSFTVSGTTTAATREVGEPGSPIFYQSSSVWWCWRAPVSGTFSLSFSNDYANHAVSVFTGKDLNQLTRLGGGATTAFQAVAGKTYYIAVNGYGGYGPDDYVLSLQPAAPPPNDNFVDRVPISGALLSVNAHNINATFEPGLNVPGGDDFASVWWTWTAPTGGLYRFTTIATNPSSAWVQAVSTQSTGILLPPPYAGGGSANSVLRAAAGEGFYVRVYGPQTPFELQIRPVPVPPNDHRSNAIVLSGLPVRTNGSLLGATSEGQTIEFDENARSPVWYRWAPPPQGAVVTAEVHSDNRDASISVYWSWSGGRGLETRTSGGDTPAHFYAVGGFEYWISIDSPWGGTRDFTLDIRPRTYPPNDNFNDRTSVTMGGYGSTAEATFEPIDDAGLRASDETETIWYSWVPPADGDYTMVMHSAGFSGRAVVFKLGESGNLVTVGGGLNMNSRFLQFHATAGTEYPITFISRQNEAGRLALKIRPSNAPANDDFVDATLLSGPNPYVDASNVDATVEPSELASSASVWWKWTPPHSGLYVVSIARSSISADVQVYRGSQFSNRVEVMPIYALDGSSLVDVTAGEEYHISVSGSPDIYGWREQQGDFTLAITSIDRPPNDDFANATVIQSPAAATGTTLGATAEAGETLPSVWWRWTAPATQTTTVQITLDRPLEVFVGASLEALTRVAVSSNWYSPSSLSFQAQAGVTYSIRVSQHAFTPFTLTLKGPAILERPNLDPLTRNADGSIHFSFNALIGTTNIIETSTDLQQWSAISTNLTDCFPYSINVPAAPQSHLFYRVRLVR
jgi:hypothetical protein